MEVGLRPTSETYSTPVFFRYLSVCVCVCVCVYKCLSECFWKSLHEYVCTLVSCCFQSPDLLYEAGHLIWCPISLCVCLHVVCCTLCVGVESDFIFLDLI